MQRRIARRSGRWAWALGLGLALAGLGLGGGTALVRAADPLVLDGDFEANGSGNRLRAREKGGRGWYESRNRSGPKEARLQLKLSTKPIGGNATRKAMLKAHLEHNTYLSQKLATPQRERFALAWDIYVREILAPFNRSAFQMIGNASARGRGPNGSGKERFVFLGFENAAEPGRINLFAFEGRDPEAWDTKRLLVPGLELKRWYTVRVEVDVAGETYRVSVPGATEAPVEVRAFQAKNAKIPTALTHVSFATWNDGPGTFYVDNVRVP